MEEDIKTYNNYHDFFKFVQNYKGELVIKHDLCAYEKGVLKAKIIK